MIFMKSPTNRIKEVLIEKGIKPRIAISDSRDFAG